MATHSFFFKKTSLRDEIFAPLGTGNRKGGQTLFVSATRPLNLARFWSSSYACVA